MARACISVVIPTLNRAQGLARTIRAWFAQDPGAAPYELVVVDDGSSDETPAMIQTLAAESPVPFRTIRLERAGLSAARNAGIRASTGTYVVNAVDDMIPAQDHLARYREALLASDGQPVVARVAWHPEIEVDRFRHYATAVSGCQCAQFRLGGRRQWVDFRFYSGAGACARREDLFQAGLHDERLWYTRDDLDMGYRLQRLGLRFLYAPEVVAYHFHAVNMAQYVKRSPLTGHANVHIASKFPELRGLLRIPRVPALLPLRIALYRTIATGAAPWKRTYTDYVHYWATIRAGVLSGIAEALRPGFRMRPLEGSPAGPARRKAEPAPAATR